MTTNTTADDFSKRGKSYQRKVVQAIFEDRDFADQIFEILKEEYFDVAYLQTVVKLLKQYHQKYQIIPSIDIFSALLDDTLIQPGEKILKDQIMAFLALIKSEPLAGDGQIVKDTALRFCIQKSLKQEIVKIAYDVQSSEFNVESIVNRMQKAAYVGHSRDIGHDYIEEFIKRTESTKRLGIPTGYEALDNKNILNSGLEPGEIGTIIAGSGVGKSVMLVNFAANALRMGYNVIYYSLELSESKIGLRFDANFSGIGQSDISLAKDVVEKSIKENCKGKLIIKAYPPRMVTVNTFKNHIRQLENTKGFRPDIIFIDYADIMGEVMVNVRREGESAYESQGSVYEQLRAFSMEVKAPVWTASQGVRAAMSEKVIKAEHIAESFRKMHTTDVAIGLSRTPEDKLDGIGRISMIKNRLGQDGLVLPISMDTSIMMVNIYEPMTSDMLESLESKNKKSKDDDLFKNLAAKIGDYQNKSKQQN